MMADVRTGPEAMARSLLGLFRHQGLLPGQVLPFKSIRSFAATNRFVLADVQDGLDYGSHQGWFEDGLRGSIRLTHAGFVEMGC